MDSKLKEPLKPCAGNQGTQISVSTRACSNSLSRICQTTLGDSFPHGVRGPRIKLGPGHNEDSEKDTCLVVSMPDARHQEVRARKSVSV